MKLTGFLVDKIHAVNIVVSVFSQLKDACVIQQRCTLFDSGCCEINKKSGVVELAVEIDDPAAQTF
jgi:hypothetical protein